MEETLLPEASVAVIARRHGVNANQVFHWRRLYREGRLDVALPGGHEHLDCCQRNGPASQIYGVERSALNSLFIGRLRYFSTKRKWNTRRLSRRSHYCLAVDANLAESLTAAGSGAFRLFTRSPSALPVPLYWPAAFCLPVSLLSFWGDRFHASLSTSLAASSGGTPAGNESPARKKRY